MALHTRQIPEAMFLPEGPLVQRLDCLIFSIIRKNLKRKKITKKFHELYRSQGMIRFVTSECLMCLTLFKLKPFKVQSKTLVVGYC